jgi:large subunit ribosomal protein L21
MKKRNTLAIECMDSVCYIAAFGCQVAEAGPSSGCLTLAGTLWYFLRMYALVEIKGKQYKAETGSMLKVDKFDKSAGETVEFDSVMLVRDDQGTRVGQPYVTGVTVKAVVQEHRRDRKILVYKYKKRKNYRRTRGHRQHYTLIKVQEIAGL